MKLIRKLFPTKEMRRYRKMYRRHRKDLIKLAKETREYDWGWLHDMVLLQIRNMLEYYSDGANVWQTDDSRQDIINKLQEVLDIQKEIEEREIDLERPLDGLNKEAELYEKFYATVGKNIMWWWD